MLIRNRFILLLSILLVGANAYIHFGWLPSFVAFEVASFERSEQKKLHLLGTSLVPDLLTMDLASLHRTLKTVRNDERDWKSLELLSPEGRRLYPLRKLQNQTQYIQQVSEIHFGDRLLGRLVLSLDTAPLIQDKTRFIIQLEYSLLVVFLLSFIMMLWFLHLWLIRPLSRLTKASQQIAGGDFAVQLPTGTSGEMNAFRDAFHFMISRIASDTKILQESEQLQGAIIDSAAYSIISTDTEGVIQSFNSKAEKMLGYQAEEVIGIYTPAKFHSPVEVKARAEVLSTELGRRIAPGFEAFVAKAKIGEPDTNEWTYIRKNHSVLPVELSVTALFDSEKNITGYLGIGFDLTEKKEADLSRRLAEMVFKNASEAILITNKNSQIIDVNPAFEKVTGYCREEALGNDPSISKSGRHDPAFYQEMWKSISESGEWSGEIWDRRKSGEIFPKYLTINAVKDIEGKVSNYVAIFKDITLQKNSEDRLEKLAYYDVLTGLPNRALFKNRLAHELKLADRHKQQIALMFIDLDRFKHVNDTLGHEAGDQLLIEVAHRLSGCVRESDTVARLGGDEFIVILADIAQPSIVAQMAEKIISRLQDAVEIGDKLAFVGASIGIGIFPEDGSDAVQLAKNADLAMYHAKDAGRGTYKFFTDQMNEANHYRAQVENDLRQALKNDELLVYYQPKVSLAGGKRSGFEALVRWKHPQLGMVGPDDFIPIAEETGLIIPIGAWVLDQACAVIARLRRDVDPSLTMAVNLSPKQFRQEGLPQLIGDTLAKYGLGPEALGIEITETAMMENMEEALKSINDIHDLGVEILLDDFGTGYSSLSYLKQFPFHTLKIDKSFVMDLEKDDDTVKLVAAILNMAQGLGLNVVAEGVELESQKDILIAHGCKTAQGYFYSRPVPESELYDLPVDI